MKLPKHVILYASWILLAAAALYVYCRPQITGVPLARSFIYLPFEIDGWKGAEKAGSEYPVSFVATDDSLVRDYTDSAGHTVELALAYFADTGDHKAPVPPQSNWVFSGWALKDLGNEEVSYGQAPSQVAVIKKMLATKRAERVLLFYCYRINGRYTADLLDFRARSVYDSITKGRNAVFTLSLSAKAGAEDIASTATAMKAFLVKALAVLETEYLP